MPRRRAHFAGGSAPAAWSVALGGTTTIALAGDRERCREAGMDDYMTKPVEMSTMVATLERWLAAGGTNQSSGP